MPNRWVALLKKRTFWVAIAAVLVPVVNAATGRELDAGEVSLVIVGLAGIFVKLLLDDLLHD